jgi:hypothetical protein
MKPRCSQKLIMVALMGILVNWVSLVLAEETKSSNDNSGDLAMKLQNPIAKLINVPIQNNWNFGIGSTQAMNYTANVQPVIPFSINDKLNLITRTIIPITYAESTVPGGNSTTGLGDIQQSFFISPEKLINGWIMGAGPIFLYPSATKYALGQQKWGAGPTAILLKQEKIGWTRGILAHHLQSFAGTYTSPTVSSSYLQPFLSYTTHAYTTFGMNSESTYNWQSREWTVPVNAWVSQLVKLNNVPIQFLLGGRYYPQKPNGTADWGLRFTVTFAFPE